MAGLVAPTCLMPTIARMGRHLQTLLGVSWLTLRHRSSLPWLQPDEQHRLLVDRLAGDYPTTSGSKC